MSHWKTADDPVNDGRWAGETLQMRSQTTRDETAIDPSTNEVEWRGPMNEYVIVMNIKYNHPNAIHHFILKIS